MPRHAPARAPVVRELQIRALAAESLRAEIIWNALITYPRQTSVERGRVARNVAGAQRNTKTVALMGAPTQFATMPPHVEDGYAVRIELRPIDRCRRAHAEPLPRDRLSVLESGIADIARRDAGELRQPSCRPLRIRAGLLDPEPGVLTVAREVDTQPFGDLEVGWGFLGFCFYRLLSWAATGTT